MASRRLPISAGQQKRLLDQLDQLLESGSWGIEVPGPRVGVLEHDRAAGASESRVRLHLLVAAPEGADLEAGVHEVERVGLERAGEEIVLDQADVLQPLLGREPLGVGEHRLVDVGSCHLPVGPNPLAQVPQPPEHAAAEIQGAGAAAVADRLEQAPAARLPDQRLQLEPLELRGLPRQQVSGRIDAHSPLRSEERTNHGPDRAVKGTFRDPAARLRRHHPQRRSCAELYGGDHLDCAALSSWRANWPCDAAWRPSRPRAS